MTFALIINNPQALPRESARMTEHPSARKDVIEDLARQTSTPVQLVRDLYEEELTKLKASATVDNFVGVIATQRVKRRLRAQRGTASRVGK